MDLSFLLNLVLTFIVGSTWITLTTLAAEKYGSKLGGWIAGLPSIVVIALLFIGITQTPAAAVQATSNIPLAVCFNGLFMVTYVFLSRAGFLFGFLAALLLWFILTCITTFAQWTDFAASMVLFVIGVIANQWLMEHFDVGVTKQSQVHYSRAQIAGRAFFAELVMVTAVVLSRLGGSVLGGILSAFPGVFASTLVITARSRGVEFSRAIAKPLMLSGMINVTVYATAVRYAYPLAGLGLGTVLALAASLVSGLLTLGLVQRTASGKTVE